MPQTRDQQQHAAPSSPLYLASWCQPRLAQDAAGPVHGLAQLVLPLLMPHEQTAAAPPPGPEIISPQSDAHR